MNHKKIVKDFKYRGRRCVVVFIDHSEIRRFAINQYYEDFKDYYNGYVELKKSEIKEDYKNFKLCEEITYQGDLSHIEKSNGTMFIGFDTAHSHNFENPETQTEEYVENKCKEIVDELGDMENENI